MTQDPKNEIIEVELSFADRARAMLNESDYKLLAKYIADGKHPLHPKTAASLFELYLNGSDCVEIQRLNPSFPYEIVLWARVEYNWDREREDYAIKLQLKVKDKLIKAQLETAGFMADMLSAANKKHGDKLKKYLQTGNDADLGDALKIESIHALLKVVEGLQKVTGQDRVQKFTKEETLNLNVNSSSPSSGNVDQIESLSPEAASKILHVLAEEKRKASNERLAKMLNPATKKT